MSRLYSRSFAAMGTVCSLHLYAAPDVAVEVGARAMMEVDRIERKYSRYRSDSLLAAINQVALVGGAIEVDAETASLIDYAHACHRKSGGLFDITSGLLRRAWDFSAETLPAPAAISALLPCIGWDKLGWSRPILSFSVPGMELDLGGIGKEYAVDRLAEICRAEGVQGGLIDLGGDIFVLGPHPDGTPWIVGLRHPRQADALLQEIAISGGGLATSGDYERCLTVDGRRYAHILHPATGWPVRGLASVTVLGPQCMIAGSLATMTMLKETAGPDWLGGLGVAHLWADEGGRVGGNLHDRALRA